MFDNTFYTRIDQILGELRAAEQVTMAVLGRCLAALTVCLRDAEIHDSSIRPIHDLLLDRAAKAASRSGREVAKELQTLLEDTPGLRPVTGADTAWSDAIPSAAPAGDAGANRWDVKELDNRLMGLNLASVGRLRHAIGLTSERPLRNGFEIRRRRRFRACATMRVSDRHDTAINGEQVDRLIRYLGWGDSDSDPRGGRHAILG